MFIDQYGNAQYRQRTESEAAQHAQALESRKQANAMGQRTNAVPRTAQAGLQGKSTGLGIDITPPNKRRGDGGPVLAQVPQRGDSAAKAECLGLVARLRGGK